MYMAGVRGAGPLRRQGALWRRRAAVRLDRSAPLPPLGRSHLTSTAQAWGLQVAAKRAGLSTFEAVAAPPGRGFSSSRSRRLGLEGDVVQARAGLYWGTHPGAQDPDPSFVPLGPLPSTWSRQPGGFPRRSPSPPSLGAHLAAAQASLQPIVTKLDLERRRSLQELRPKEGAASGEQPAAARGGSTTYLRQGQRVSGQGGPA